MTWQQVEHVVQTEEQLVLHGNLVTTETSPGELHCTSSSLTEEYLLATDKQVVSTTAAPTCSSSRLK